MVYSRAEVASVSKCEKLRQANMAQRYEGANPPAPVYAALPAIREKIWQTQITGPYFLFMRGGVGPRNSI